MKSHTQIALLRLMANRQYLNIHQIMRVKPQGRKGDPHYSSAVEEAFPLLQSVKYENVISLKFLLSDDFANVWNIDHVNLAIDTAIQLGNIDFLVEILRSFSCQSSYSAMPRNSKTAFIKDLFKKVPESVHETDDNLENAEKLTN